MRILVWGINYAPEMTGIAPYNTSLCEFLARRGNDVRMVTTFSYYPTWKKRPEDFGKLYRTDTISGITVHRWWHYVPARVSSLKRIIHEFTFGLPSLARVLTLPRADVYVVVSPPLALGAIAWLATRLKRSRYIFHVQDLQPDAALGLGMVKPGLFTHTLFALEAFAYRNAAAVGGISSGMLAAFERKGVPAEKRWYFPNWTAATSAKASAVQGERLKEEGADTADVRSAFRSRYGLPANAFLAVYSGNLGRKQGLRILLDAARLLPARAASAAKNTFPPLAAGSDQPFDLQPAISNDNDGAESLCLVIAGDGAMRGKIEAELARESTPNVRLLPLLPDADYRLMLPETTVAIITQEKGTVQFFFPSTLLSVLSAALPGLTVAYADSELARAVAEGNFGVNVPPGEPATLARELNRLYANRETLPTLAANGRNWVERFNPENVLGEFEARLKAL